MVRCIGSTCMSVRLSSSLPKQPNEPTGQFVSPVEDISARGFKAVIETNLHSCFLLSKEVRGSQIKWRGRAEARHLCICVIVRAIAIVTRLGSRFPFLVIIGGAL
jgi:hypothetical protein